MFNLIREPWPLDGMELETLAEQRTARKLEDPEIDYGIFSQHFVS